MTIMSDSLLEIQRKRYKISEMRAILDIKERELSKSESHLKSLIWGSKGKVKIDLCKLIEI